MKQIIALQEYSDKYISLYEGEIRNIEDILADKLIEQGVVSEHNNSSEDSGNNIFIIHGEKEDTTATTFTIKQTFNECLQASKEGEGFIYTITY